MPDVVELITEQHRRIDELLTEAEEAQPDQLRSLLQEVAGLLIPHSQAEEAIVYPAIRDHDDRETEDVEDSLVEHHQVEVLLQELIADDPSAPGFEGRLAAMIGELRHHVAEEESVLLPVLSEKADDAERDELGTRFAEVSGAEPAAGKSRPKGRSGSRSGSREGGEGRGGGGGGGGREHAATGRTREERTREELYQEAKEKGIPGRSGMSKEELARAVDPKG